MKALGLTSGIGSMLVGARNAGFEVVGNIEWRRYYHTEDSQGRNTFTENFPGAFMVHTIDEAPEYWLKDIDIVFGHPDCGPYSCMSYSVNGDTCEMQKLPSDLPLFTELVSKVKPRFFVMDNLPKSLIGYPIERWYEDLPDYDLFPEWISNWGYGNIQKFRNRFFMIGARKGENFTFRPNEVDEPKALRDRLKNLPTQNHDEYTMVGNTGKARGMHTGVLDKTRFLQWGELFEVISNLKNGGPLKYYANDGSIKTHIGWVKTHPDKHCHTITGGCPVFNPLTNKPFTLRERCRIQGLPDDFLLYGTIYEEDGTWNHMRNMAMIKQTGKCMPVQFCQYVAEQIAAHINDEPFECNDNRILKPNKYVTKAKRFLCLKNHYHHDVCGSCWIDNCDV